MAENTCHMLTFEVIHWKAQTKAIVKKIAHHTIIGVLLWFVCSASTRPFTDLRAQYLAVRSYYNLDLSARLSVPHLLCGLYMD